MFAIVAHKIIPHYEVGEGGLQTSDWYPIKCKNFGQCIGGVKELQKSE